MQKTGNNWNGSLNLHHVFLGRDEKILKQILPSCVSGGEEAVHHIHSQGLSETTGTCYDRDLVFCFIPFLNKFCLIRIKNIFCSDCLKGIMANAEYRNLLHIYRSVLWIATTGSQSILRRTNYGRGRSDGSGVRWSPLTCYAAQKECTRVLNPMPYLRLWVLLQLRLIRFLYPWKIKITEIDRKRMNVFRRFFFFEAKEAGSRKLRLSLPCFPGCYTRMVNVADKTIFRLPRCKTARQGRVAGSQGNRLRISLQMGPQSEWRID